MSDDQMFGETDLEIENQRLMEANQKLQGRIKRLNAFLVEQGLAEKYIRWKGDDCMSEEQETIVIKLTPTYWGYEAEVVIDDE